LLLVSLVWIALILAIIECRGVVFKVMFHPKQLMVISAGDDADIRVWDLITKSCAATLKVFAAPRPPGRARP
jgi:hypothetical protein